MNLLALARDHNFHPVILQSFLFHSAGYVVIISDILARDKLINAVQMRIVE
jgi:hypothetical protein